MYFDVPSQIGFQNKENNTISSHTIVNFPLYIETKSFFLFDTLFKMFFVYYNKTPHFKLPTNLILVTN